VLRHAPDAVGVNERGVLMVLVEGGSGMRGPMVRVRRTVILKRRCYRLRVTRRHIHIGRLLWKLEHLGEDEVNTVHT